MVCPEGFVFGGLDGSLGLDLKSPLSPDPLMRVGDTTRTGRRDSALAPGDVFDAFESSHRKRTCRDRGIAGRGPNFSCSTLDNASARISASFKLAKAVSTLRVNSS